MRQVVMHAHILKRLSDNEPATSWMVRLAEAGLFRPEDAVEEGSPQADMAEIYQHTMALCDLEETVANNRATRKRLHLLPVYAPIFVVILWLLSMGWGLQAEDYGDRLERFALFWTLLGAGSVCVVLVLRAKFLERERRRGIELEDAKKMAEWTRGEIFRIRDRLVERDFVAQIKGRLVVHLPHRAWLERQLRNLSADHTALADTLRTYIEHIDAQVERLAADPPKHWESEGLTIDAQTIKDAYLAAGMDDPWSQPTG